MKLHTHQREAEVYMVTITEVNKLVYVCRHKTSLAVCNTAKLGIGPGDLLEGLQYYTPATTFDVFWMICFFFCLVCRFFEKKKQKKNKNNLQL